MLTPHLITDRDTWNALLRDLPTAHILQTWEWGEFKQATTGWTPTRYAYRDAQGQTVAAASLLTRKMAVLRVIYVPKGPALDYENPDTREGVLNHLQGLARRPGVVWLKIDPDLPIATGLPDTPADTPYTAGLALRDSLERRGWVFSSSQVQFRNTMTLDLTRSEDDLLAAMNQSTRRKVRKATAHVRAANLSDPASPDFDALYRLYQETGARQDFITRPADYYRRAWTTFIEAGLGHALIAESEGEAIGGVVLFAFGRKVWYFYGMSRDGGDKDAHANHALQWAAIRWAREAGYPMYDWWGAPDIFTEADPMWGVYRFKEGFGGEVVRHIGAWDYIPNRPLYRLYESLLPRLLGRKPAP